MSTYWDVHCVDCDAGLGLHGNHMEEAATNIARAAVDLATCGDLIPGLRIPCETYNFWNNETGSGFAAAWFSEHRGHQIRARNEYGGYNEKCRKWFSCKYCSANVCCSLEENHDGDHARVLP